MFGRNRLKIYTVHIKPGEEKPAQPLLFVREGFCWGGFLLGFLWTLYHRLWLPTLLNFLFWAAVMGIYGAGYLSDISNIVLQLAQMVFIGLEGNNWLRTGLARRGYITAGVVSGESLEVAQRRYFEQQLAANPV